MHTEGDTLRIGVIGTGNMGSMLAAAFATGPEFEVWVYNRSPKKAEVLARRAPSVRIVQSAEDLACRVDVLFLCTKAQDGKEVMSELGPLLTDNQILATTISTIPVCHWEAMTRSRVVKVIPSIVQTALSGVILVHYGARFTPDTKAGFERLLMRMAIPHEVNESQLRVASDLTSCGPALVAYLLREWAKMASITEHVSFRDAEYLLTQTAIGLSDLLRSGMTLEEVITKVSVPGGVTERAIQALSQRAPEMFQTLHMATEEHTRAHNSPAPIGRET